MPFEWFLYFYIVHSVLEIHLSLRHVYAINSSETEK